MRILEPNVQIIKNLKKNQTVSTIILKIQLKYQTNLFFIR